MKKKAMVFFTIFATPAFAGNNFFIHCNGETIKVNEKLLKGGLKTPCFSARLAVGQYDGVWARVEKEGTVQYVAAKHHSTLPDGRRPRDLTENFFISVKDGNMKLPLSYVLRHHGLNKKILTPKGHVLYDEKSNTLTFENKVIFSH